MTELVCPMRRCQTMLQRRSNGNLADGIALHLRAVHNVGKAKSREIAGRWVKDHRLPDGCLIEHKPLNPNCTKPPEDDDAVEP